MAIGRFGQINKIFPVLVSADITTSDTKTAIVDLKNAHRCTFLVMCGAITSASSTEPTILVKASSAATTTSAVAIAGKYRLSGAVATDTIGEITAFTAAAGVTPLLTADNSLIMIDVDPTDVRNGTTNKNGRFVHLLMDTSASMSNWVVGALCEIEPRYAQNSMPSAS
jgi:hypothetical protein